MTDKHRKNRGRATATVGRIGLCCGNSGPRNNRRWKRIGTTVADAQKTRSKNARSHLLPLRCERRGTPTFSPQPHPQPHPQPQRRRRIITCYVLVKKREETSRRFWNSGFPRLSREDANGRQSKFSSDSPLKRRNYIADMRVHLTVSCCNKNRSIRNNSTRRNNPSIHMILSIFFIKQ